MSDLLLELTEDGPDLVLEAGDLKWDRSLLTDVVVSLFSDARASSEDTLPDARDVDLRGWWGQATLDELWGSLLWLADRSKVMATTANAMQAWAAEALEWITEEGIAEEVVVTTETEGSHIGLDIEVRRGAATVHPELWEATGELELGDLTVRLLAA